jgi:endo-alpha-1,4-polygalactosaminidase (GH114 family)
MQTKKKRAFVSSTMREFATERHALKRALAGIGVEVILFEDAGAGNQDAWTFDQQLIATCDIFIGIYAAEYGSNPKGKRSAWIENEYKIAASHKKTILPYIKQVEQRDARLDKFLRAHILRNHKAAYFRGRVDLIKQITRDVAALI